MNDKDLIEFFIYLRDNCYNRDFNMEPKRVVECFYEYRNAGYKLPIHDVSNFVLLAKPNYKAKDGTIKRGIEIGGKYYAPQNDC